MLGFIGAPALGLGWVLGRDLRTKLGYAEVYAVLPRSQRKSTGERLYVCMRAYGTFQEEGEFDYKSDFSWQIEPSFSFFSLDLVSSSDCTKIDDFVSFLIGS
jgi:hypothetical protein